MHRMNVCFLRDFIDIFDSSRREAPSMYVNQGINCVEQDFLYMKSSSI